MPNLTITKNYSDNNELDAIMLDAALDSVSTFINTTKLDSQNLQSGAVVETTIAAGAVTESKIAINSVSTAKIPDSAITTVKIADLNVTTAKLEQTLQDRLTEFLTPTGVISAYAATSAPSGWLLCDGTPISRTTYARLFAIIGVTHGDGSKNADGTPSGLSGTHFNLPDYRGRFLRGVDSGAGNDTDAAGRTAMNVGGNTGNTVGTIQGDAFKSHNHTYSLDVTSGSTSFNNAVNGNASTFTSNSTSSVGGTETRPKNASVNFIIKT